MDLKQTILGKGWKLKDAAKVWKITPRRLRQLIAEDSFRTQCTVRGLPNRYKDMDQQLE